MCGDVITTRAVLTENLNCTTDPGLIVEGPGGNLDMRGFRLTCTALAIGIRLQGQGAVVRNGTVTRCVEGLVLDPSGGHQVQRMTLRNNLDDGLTISNGSGVNQITESTASGNGGEGFIIGRSNLFSRNTATGNTATGNGAAGFLTDFNNTLTRNVATGNSEEGFIVFGSGNKLRQNVARQNTGDGFRLLSHFGDADSNELAQNAALNNKGDGIDVELGANDNTLTQNAGSRNGSADTEGDGGFDLEDNNSVCDNNTWRMNAGTRNQPCIQ